MELKMKKATRVVIAGACAAALALGAALPAFADGEDPKSGTTKVSYNTSTTIDTNVGWVVRIPSSLSFDLATAKTGVDVKVAIASKTSAPLQSLTDFPGYVASTGAGVAPTYGTVDVHVTSKNNMQLKLESGADPLQYTLTSPDGKTSWTTDSGKPTPENPKPKPIEGPADGDPHGLNGPIFCAFKQADAGATDTEMIKVGRARVDSTPTKDGDHTDVLTFGFNSKPPEKTPPAA